MGRVGRKKNSQLFTFAEIVRNNSDIFCKQYPRMPREPDEHYICKAYLGNMIKKYFGYNVEFEYEKLDTINTSLGDRLYQPDIWVSDTDHKNKEIKLSICEISGGIHFKNKIQYNKNRLRRESITEYFKTYSDRAYPDYNIIFSYLVFTPDDFLYNKFDFFREIFEEKFMNGGHYFEY